MLISQTIEKLNDFYPLTPVQQDDMTRSTWFVPADGHLPLTLSWEEEESGISCVNALGRLKQGTDASIPLQLMTLNLMMAAHGGPRFSYSRSSDLLTIMDFIPMEAITTGNIYAVREQIDALIEKSQQVRLYLESEGIKLTENQE